jgi:hypothetical protein
VQVLDGRAFAETMAVEYQAELKEVVMELRGAALSRAELGRAQKEARALVEQMQETCPAVDCIDLVRDTSNPYSTERPSC